MEIKVGKTVNQDYFKEFRHLDGILAMPEGKLPVCGGDIPHIRRDVKITTVCQVAEHVTQVIGLLIRGNR